MSTPAKHTITDYVTTPDLINKLLVNNLHIYKSLLQDAECGIDRKGIVCLPLSDDVVVTKNRIEFIFKNEARMIPVNWNASFFGDEKWNCLSIVPVNQLKNTPEEAELCSPIVRLDVQLMELLSGSIKNISPEHNPQPCILYNGYLLDPQMFTPNQTSIKFITMPSHYSVQLCETSLNPYNRIGELVDMLNIRLATLGRIFDHSQIKCDDVIEYIHKQLAEATQGTLAKPCLPGNKEFSIYVVEETPNLLRCFSSIESVEQEYPLLDAIFSNMNFSVGFMTTDQLFTRHRSYPHLQVSLGKSHLYSICKSSVRDLHAICTRDNTIPSLSYKSE